MILVNILRNRIKKIIQGEVQQFTILFVNSYRWFRGPKYIGNK